MTASDNQLATCSNLEMGRLFFFNARKCMLRVVCLVKKLML